MAEVENKWVTAEEMIHGMEVRALEKFPKHGQRKGITRRAQKQSKC